MSSVVLKKQIDFLYRLNKALYQDSDESTRLNFNILGHHYEIPVTILNNYPNTLLGEPKLRAAYYDYKKDEFIFDRHPHAFESIVTFYLSDGSSLSKPTFMPTEIFYDELKFFRFKPSILRKYYEQEITPLIDIQILPRNKWKCLFWLMINYSTRDWKSRLMYTIDFLLNLIALWTFLRDCISDQKLSQIIFWIEEDNRQVLRPIYHLFHQHISTVCRIESQSVAFLIDCFLFVKITDAFRANMYNHLFNSMLFSYLSRSYISTNLLRFKFLV